MTDEFGAGDGALKGLRVLDLGQLVQGPQAAQLLSDLGADVIKVELPGVGDLSRRLPVSLKDPRPPFFIGCNRGKRAVTIDLRLDAGREVFLDLVATSDVVISNFVNGTMEGWGLGYDVMAERNPRIVWGSGTAFGSRGPDADQRGADLAGQAAGGLLSVMGADDHRPIGVTIADHIGSQNLSNGILAALFARERTGTGQHVEVSLLGGIIYAQASELTMHFLSGEIRKPVVGGHPLIPLLYGTFASADGHIALVGVPEDLKAAFFELIDRPDLTDDPGHSSLAFLQGGREEFCEILATEFARLPSAEWERRFRRAGIRYAPVRDYSQVASDPGSHENGYLQRIEHHEWGDMVGIGSPVTMSATPATPGRVAPELGEHTDEVLTEIGYSSDAVANLRAVGVI